MKYVLGLGSNLGVPAYNLRQAVEKIKAVDCAVLAYSSIYKSKALLKPNAPQDWELSFLNAAILVDTTLTPLSLLEKIKAIETQMGRSKTNMVWSPRVIDIDILAMENDTFQHEMLSIPHKELLNRHFALLPLLDVLPDWCSPNLSNQALRLHCDTLEPCQKLAVSLNGPMMMGICNLTHDSFSEVGTGIKTVSRSFQDIQHLVTAGAHIIDIGAESTSLEAKGLNDADELLLLEHILDEFAKKRGGLTHVPLISIDTRKASIMNALLHNYPFIWMLNDVEGSDLVEKAQLVVKYNLNYVLTHHLGVIGRSAYLSKETAIEELLSFFNEKVALLNKLDVKASQIYLDVGFGYGKDEETAQVILQHLHKLKALLGLPLLIGHSRKPSVIGASKTASIEELDAATQQLSLWLADNGADILRVHQVV